MLLFVYSLKQRLATTDLALVDTQYIVLLHCWMVVLLLLPLCCLFFVQLLRHWDLQSNAFRKCRNSYVSDGSNIIPNPEGVLKYVPRLGICSLHTYYLPMLLQHCFLLIKSQGLHFWHWLFCLLAWTAFGPLRSLVFLWWPCKQLEALVKGCNDGLFRTFFFEAAAVLLYRDHSSSSSSSLTFTLPVKDIWPIFNSVTVWFAKKWGH